MGIRKKAYKHNFGCGRMNDAFLNGFRDLSDLTHPWQLRTCHMPVARFEVTCALIRGAIAIIVKNIGFSGHSRGGQVPGFLPQPHIIKLSLDVEAPHSFIYWLIVIDQYEW